MHKFTFFALSQFYNKFYNFQALLNHRANACSCFKKDARAGKRTLDLSVVIYFLAFIQPRHSGSP
jgi:hypothetical protein